MKKTATDRQLALFQTRCHEQGLRVTPQRMAIFEELCCSDSHPTAEKLYLEVKRRYPTISLNTVNQTLLTFAKVGIVGIVEGFGSARRYDPIIDQHHHVHCVKCGKILDFYHTSFDRLKVPEEIREAYQIMTTRVVVAGVCPACQKKDKKRQ